MRIEEIAKQLAPYFTGISPIYITVPVFSAPVAFDPLGAIALGNPPPTSATAGTGIWIDRTGMYGLNADTQEVIFDAATGKITAGAGDVILDKNGLSLNGVAGFGSVSTIIWNSGGINIASVYGGINSNVTDLMIWAKGLDISNPDSKIWIQALKYNDTTIPNVSMYLDTAGSFIQFYVGGTNMLQIDVDGVHIDAVFLPFQATSAPSYIKGGVYFDTTLNKLRIGGVAAWETVTSI